MDPLRRRGAAMLPSVLDKVVATAAKQVKPEQQRIYLGLRSSVKRQKHEDLLASQQATLGVEALKLQQSLQRRSFGSSRRLLGSSRALLSGSSYHDNTKARMDYERSQASMDKLRAETAVEKPAAVAATTEAASTRITSATVREQQKVLFPRLTEEAGEDEFDEQGAENKSTPKGKKEVGFKYMGREPTSFGDWSHKGRVTDF
ncbi:unnamed protein product [Amoebophrya sp. A25]|nr:unnamed protein product [Amoebophrya sp. A25]|eukprot:GSA25T00004942001.1